MKPTRDYIAKKFDEFNEKIFANRLAPLPIKMAHVKSYLGACVCKKRLLPGGTIKKYDFALRFNADMDLEETQIEDVVIHEMIHYYIDSKGLHDTSAHGPLFQRMMSEINARHGRHVNISYRLPNRGSASAVATRPRWHVVARLSMSDGRTAVKVLPRIVQRIVGFDRALRHAPQVKGAEYFLSNDPYFNRFPNSSALRVHFIEADEFNCHLQGAERLECRGGQVVRNAGRYGEGES